MKIYQGVARGALLLLAALCLFNLATGDPGMPPARAQGTEQLVHVVFLDGDIDGGQQRFLRRALDQAHRDRADLVLVEITTLGGWLDVALKMRDDIFESRVPVWIFVRSRAWSAGVMIAIAGENLVMAPGSSIGAAEPRPADEKTISAVKADMEETARVRGRDPQLVAAMVDASIEIPEVIEAGKILTLKAQEAVDLGLADLVASSRHQALQELGVEDYREVVVEASPAERLASFVTSPAVAPLLLSLGFLGLLAELFVPGFGFPGVLGIVFLGLFFGGHMLAGFAGVEVIALFLVGVVLLATEVFVSGFGLVGAAGGLALLGSIFLASPTPEMAARSIVAALVTTVVGLVVFLKYGKRFPFWKNLVLMESEVPERGYTAFTRREELEGKEGVAVTSLRPSGTVEMEGQLLDVVAEGGFVRRGQRVRITRVTGMRIVVRGIDPPEPEKEDSSTEDRKE